MMGDSMKPKSERTTPNKSRAVVRRHRQREAKSQTALRVAMGELLFEQPFHAITVQQLLERAGIGRTTFYAHFQDKDDLLLASFTGMLDMMTSQLASDPPGTRRLLPVREFFTHVAAAAPVMATLQDTPQWSAMWSLASAHFARTVEPRAGSTVTARFLAGAMMELLQWWLARTPRPPAETMDAEFHALANRLVPPR